MHMHIIECCASQTQNDGIDDIALRAPYWNSLGEVALKTDETFICYGFIQVTASFKNKKFRV